MYLWGLFLPARLYAIAGKNFRPVFVSVCYKWEFYRNGWTDRADF